MVDGVLNLDMAFVANVLSVPVDVSTDAATRDLALPRAG